SDAARSETAMATWSNIRPRLTTSRPLRPPPGVPRIIPRPAQPSEAPLDRVVNDEPRERSRALIDIITLAVADLERALAFYRDALGLESRGVVGEQFAGDDVTPAGAVVMFKPSGGPTLALYPRTERAKDAKVSLGPPKTGEFSLGHFASSRAEVDDLLERAGAAGATVTDLAHDRPWGIYSGYFSDLDGHLWEVIWSPGDAS